MGVYDIKQYILINGNTKWTKGKILSQACHASMAVITQYMKESKFFPYIKKNTIKYKMNLPLSIDFWLQGAFAKISLKVNNLIDLNYAKNLAIELNIPFSYIKDNGATQADDEGVTVAIGPYDTTQEYYKKMNDFLSQFKLY